MRTLVTLLAAGLVLASCESPPANPSKTPEPAAGPAGPGALDQLLEETGNATFDATWEAPACTALGSRCDSGELLKGRADLGPELHPPNTVGGSCADGTQGTSGAGPSLERLAVSRADGTAFAAGKEVTVQATVLATSTFWKQALDLYVAPDASSPTWTLVASLEPQYSGTQVLSATYLLPAGGGLQVLRGVYRTDDTPASACSPGPFNDHDDLVMAVGVEPDSTPPTVAITSPAQGATLRNTVTVAVNASDNLGVQRVELYEGSTLLATDAQAPFSPGWATRTVPNGSYTLTVRAYDAAGHVSTSAPVHVLVDNDFVPPTLSFVTPTEGATVSQTVPVSGLVDDDRGVVSVEIEIGPANCNVNACAIQLLRYSASEPFTQFQVDWDTRSTANGSRILRARAYDKGGNASAPVTLNVMVDNDRIPPVTAITAPSSGSVLSGQVSVEASASDDRGSLASVSFYVDGHLIQTDTTAPYAIAWDSASMSNGSHTLHTVASDGRGNQATSAPVTVETNNPGADVSYDPVLKAPRCGSVRSSCDSRNLLRGRADTGLEPNAPNTLGTCVEGSIYNSTYNEAIERIRVIRLDGTALAPGKRVRLEVDVWVSQASLDALHLYYTADATRPSWTPLTAYGSLSPPPGTSNQSLVTLSAEYILPAGGLQAVRAEFGFGEGFGTCSVRSPWVSVTDHDDLVFPVGQEVDTLPPEVAITSPAPGAAVSGEWVPVSISTSDNFDVVAVELYDGQTRLSRSTHVPFSLGWNSWRYPSGSHTLTVRAYDAAGNVGSSAPVVVDVEPERTPPSVSLTAPAPGARLTGTVTLSAEAIDSGSGMSQIELLLDGTQLQAYGSALHSWSTRHSWDTRTVASGGHTLTLRATDPHGNVATASVEVTVDNEGPAVALTSPASGATVGGVVPLQADATDGAGVTRVEFYVDGVLLGSDTTAPFGVDWDTRGMANGNHTLQARAHDAFNHVTTSAQVTVNTLQPGSAVYNSTLRVPWCATLNTVCDTTTLVQSRSYDERNSPNTIYSQCYDGSASAGEAQRERINRLKVSSVDGAPFASGGRVRLDVHVTAFDTATNALDLFSASDARNPSWTYLTTLRPGATGAQVLSAEYVLPAGYLQAVRAQFRSGGDSGSACSTGSYDERDDVAFAVDGDPTVTLTAPSHGARVTGLVSLTATASSASAMNRVEFYVDGTLLSSDTSAPYEVSWDSTRVADGAHSLTARAYDAGGRVGTSAAVGVDVDTTPPEVALTSPAQGAFLRHSVVLEATASDSGGGVAKVEFYRGTTLLGTDTSAPYSMSWSTTGVADGAHTFSVKAYDNLGHIGTSPGVEVIIDKTSPSEPALTAPAAYTLVRGTIQVSATTSDNLGVARVEFYVDDTRMGTDTSAPYEVSWDTTALADGAHTLRATAYDHAGNWRSSGMNIPVTTDNTPPDAALTAPGQGALLRGSVTLEATASDTRGVARVEFYRGTTLLGADSTAPYTWSWNTAGVGDGAWTLWVKAYDKTGNVRASAGVEVSVDNTAPVTAVSAPEQGTRVRGSVPVSATASDAVGVERVEFYADTTLLGTVTTAPYVVSWDTTAGAQGSVTLTTRAYDAVGHVTVSAGHGVSVDNGVPTVAITSPANGASFFLTVSTTIQASASDNVGVTQVVFYDGASVIGTDSTAPYSVSWNLLNAAKGTHTLTARAHDEAGNVTTSAPISVKVN
jgi:hypothetical protein